MNQLIRYILFLVFAAVSLCAASPYAPERVGYALDDNDVAEYTYDRAGNRISDSKGQTITYGLIGKVEDIETPMGIVSFRHGPGGGRYLRKDPNGDTTFYVGGREHCVPAGGRPAKSTIHVRNGRYSPVAQLETSSGNTDYICHLRDHQGTALVSVDDAGAVLSERQFDVWGMARDVDGAEATLDESVRGYTGHENIKPAELIQANGRIFDPKVKLFTSADPVVFGGNLVSHNRYAYGLNSPSNYIDVTGYMMRQVGEPNRPARRQQQADSELDISETSFRNLANDPNYDELRGEFRRRVGVNTQAVGYSDATNSPGNPQTRYLSHDELMRGVQNNRYAQSDFIMLSRFMDMGRPSTMLPSVLQNRDVLPTINQRNDYLNAVINMHDNNDLEQLAIMHANGEIDRNLSPFVSLAANPLDLFLHTVDDDVQGIVMGPERPRSRSRRAPHLAHFRVPTNTNQLYFVEDIHYRRNLPLAEPFETEVLFLGEDLNQYLIGYQENPFGRPRQP